MSLLGVVRLLSQDVYCFCVIFFNSFICRLKVSFLMSFVSYLEMDIGWSFCVVCFLSQDVHFLVFIWHHPFVVSRCVLFWCRSFALKMLIVGFFSFIFGLSICAMFFFLLRLSYAVSLLFCFASFNCCLKMSIVVFFVSFVCCLKISIILFLGVVHLRSQGVFCFGLAFFFCVARCCLNISFLFLFLRHSFAFSRCLLFRVFCWCHSCVPHILFISK